MKIRVYYEDTDAGGIVYHANYLKFCERARSELFFQKGIAPTLGSQSSFVVRHIDANFMATASLGDILMIQTTLLKAKATSVKLLQEIFRGETKVFSMEILLVYIENGKPVRIPEDFRDILC